MMNQEFIAAVMAAVLCGCVSNPQPYPGPDKRGAGFWRGATAGAGAGAVTGAQFMAGTGPGALVGAGLGAVAGSITGGYQDEFEEEQIDILTRTARERELALVHERLNEHYQRRLALHPTRDIYPADWFFFGDESKLKDSAKPLVREIALMNKQRMPWSKLVIAAYAKSRSGNSSYAKHLASARSKELMNYFVKAGLEPRRLEARGLAVKGPVLVDPDDDPERYSQAVEIILEDR